MTSSRTTKPKNIRELDLLTYRQKAEHWGFEEDPWKPSGGRYRFANPEFRIFPMIWDGGDITKSPFVLGRPCFAIPTAFIRFHQALKFVHGRGLLPASRCAACNLFDKCDQSVKRRLGQSPDLRSAHDEFMLAGGPSGFNSPGWEHRKFGRVWRRFVRLIADHPFENANDKEVAAHYARRDAEKLEEDRKRKKRDRQKKVKAGELDAEHLRRLTTAANERVKKVALAVKHARAHAGPKELRQLTRESLIDLRNVWMGRQILVLQGKRVNAAEIARWIRDQGLRDTSVNLNALATRVRKDIARIERLEKLEFAGERLIAPFNARVELS